MDALSAVAAPVRREILRLVWDDERPAGEIAEAFDVTFGAVSQHLRILREAGLVEFRREGRHRFYRARKEKMGPIRELLEAMWVDRLKRLRALAEEREKGEAR
ncbi:MAG: ArsR/SmtB family transcription factor [Gemmatimonadota bacterium]